jgi:hypothetical protein
VKGLLAGAWLSLQAEPFGRAAGDQDHGERSAVKVVAGGTMTMRASVMVMLTAIGSNTFCARRRS